MLTRKGGQLPVPLCFAYSVALSDNTPTSPVTKLQTTKGQGQTWSKLIQVCQTSNTLALLQFPAGLLFTSWRILPSGLSS